MKRDPAPAGLAAVLTIFLTSCASLTTGDSDKAFAACPAYAPAYQVTDDFMRTFNSKNAEAWGATFHFPSVRIASNNVRIINSAADLDSFANLAATGWDHSAWAKREMRVEEDMTRGRRAHERTPDSASTAQSGQSLCLRQRLRATSFAAAGKVSSRRM